MNFDLGKLADPQCFSENRLAAHSDHRWFASPQEAADGVSSFEQSLSGLWKFHYAKNPSLIPEGFEAVGYDCSSWDDIRVPGHIQLAGHKA